MPPEVEAKLLELRREHPGSRPRTMGHELGLVGVVPVLARSLIYRCLMRHGLITSQAMGIRRPSNFGDHVGRPAHVELCCSPACRALHPPVPMHPRPLRESSDQTRRIRQAHLTRRATPSSRTRVVELGPCDVVSVVDITVNFRVP